MNDIDELLLEHFGTKGMRWGVRNSSARKALTRHAQKSVSGRSARAGRKTGKFIREHQDATKRVAIGVAGAALMGIGAMQVNRILKETGGINLSRAKNSKDYIDVGSRVVKTMFDKKAIISPAKMLMRGA